MSALSYTDEYIKTILDEVKTIALVGASDKQERPSYRVANYLLEQGYKVIPVNPGKAGQKILGQEVFASLADIDDPVDMVDIFRNSEAAGTVTEDAISIGAKVIWMQLDVINHDAAKRAENAGLKVVMDRCPKIELPRLAKLESLS
ncbi:MAG: CoA-binding protein [Cohaesibacter sp.]|nr:CoA-binding protein [Cohaesibacter sp.]